MLAVSPSHICHLETVYTQGIQANTGARTRQGSQKTLHQLQSRIRDNEDSPSQWEAGDSGHIFPDSVSLSRGLAAAEHSRLQCPDNMSQFRGGGMLPTRLRTLQSLESAITRFERCWSISFVAPDLRVTSSPLHWPHYITVYHMQYSACTVHYTG